MATRTNQLGRGLFGAAGTFTLYTVPAATRTIVKQFTIANLGGGAANFLLLYSDGSNNFGVYSNTAFAGHSSQFISTYDVLLVGQQIQIIVATPAVTVWISGTELVGP